ncbi:hypothetical protein [Cryobacterium psychrophilum]|uniref:Secreted protein n=1 Tax=Cryobacterium psychrophilum TaxID=41988 RepID=A0A4Y8KMQ2_9MICO|nr:hypothetical protein [Cryobacterium psychrophilum]TDW30354.1 hypothetical protein EDD25_2105 [Cryobacterium psychrophilum]TFD79049.1 hypothetical protein E3T53_08075 [Cryobacterium psychrophilum]
MLRSPRRPIAALAAATTLSSILLFTGCSSGSYSYDEPTAAETLTEASSPVDPATACGALVAAPAGLAQQKAAELGCVEDDNGNWVHQGEPAPAAPAPLPIAPAAETQPGGGIPWNQAVDYAGTTQRVCGPLAGGGNSGDDVFLNLGRDYPDPERFQIVVWDVGSLESIDGGVTLCTSGQITLYEGVAQIELTDPSLIAIYN